jgi:type VI secretion system protein ImpL
MLLFLFFEAVVAVVTTFVWPDASVFLACAAMTGLAVAVWVVFVFLTRIMMRPRAPQPAPQPRAAVPIVPKASFGDDSFTQELTELVREANRRLVGVASTNARGEQPTIANLPLFLVIGGEGAGKTSALVNSGLDPRLLAGEATREGTVLPTKLCNLWFAEGSVFADISGRVVMQDSEHWERTLRVLSERQQIPKWKRILFGQRGQANLKGLVLLCDTNMFLRANDSQRVNAFARTVNERLQTVGAIFRKEFPVYVVFSKCDSVQYFPEFFAHLSEPEGRRLLGVTFPFVKTRNDTADIYTDREGKRLTTYFNRLYMSLADKRMVLLAREDEAKKKSTAYEFPRELKKVRGDVVQFLLDTFRPNPLQQGPRLRGFYFSGQRWVARTAMAGADGSVADFSVVRRRSDATVFFGAKPQSGGNPAVARAGLADAATAKWMFLTEVFHNVILKDRAGHVAPRVNTRDQVYRNLAFGGVGGLLLVLSLLWANSWRNNREMLNAVQSSIAATQLVAPTVANQETLSELESLRTSLAQLQEYDRHGAPLWYRWGLYAGNDATIALHRLYFDRFRRMFMDPMLGVFTARFLSLQSSAPVQDDVYNLLKSYRMITSGECPPDDNILGTTLMPVWSSAVSSPPGGPEFAEKQMQFYVAELKIENPYKQQITEDSKATTRAQAYLRDLNSTDRIFRALLEQVNHDKQGDMLSLYAAKYTEVMTGPNSIEGAYTRAGWDAMIDSVHSHKLASAGETCVLGKTSRFSNLTLDAATERDVEELYIKSYIQHWKQFLAAHHVVVFSGTADAARKLSILADNNRSPLLGLVYMASHNTDVASSSSVAEGVTQAVEQGMNTAKQRINSELDKLRGKKSAAPQGPAQPPSILRASDIVHEFEPVRAVVDPVTADRWLSSKNQDYIKALEALGLALAAIPPRPDPKLPTDQQAIDGANKAKDSANTALHTLTGSFPSRPSQVDVDLKALLGEPIKDAERVLAHLPQPPPPLPPPPPPPDPTIPVKAQVNKAEQTLCSSVDAIRAKYPFNAMASQEATPQDLNEVFASATGTLAQFEQSPDVSKTYVRQGKAWAPNPSFPATFSQPFLLALNNLSEFSENLYADGGSNPHFDYTLTLDGTGKVPFELDVDGHVIKYIPKKPNVPVRLVWPPITSATTKLVLKTGLTLPAQNSGPWSLFHLLQAADDQNGSLFTFRTIQFAGSGHVPLQDGNGNPVTIQVRIDSPTVGNIFGRGYFSKLHCEGWAVH